MNKYQGSCLEAGVLAPSEHTGYVSELGGYSKNPGSRRAANLDLTDGQDTVDEGVSISGNRAGNIGEEDPDEPADDSSNLLRIAQGKDVT